MLLNTCSPSGDIYSSDPLGLVVFFAIGLFGSAHCLGMCGPLVTLYAERMATEDRRGELTVRHVRQHALFNIGRTTSYALLGGVFGLAGDLVFISGRQMTTVATEIRAISGLAVGVLIVLVGLQYATGQSPSMSVGSTRLASAITDRVLPRIDRWVGDTRIVGLGATHGLLPCPLLYPAFLYAFVQGSPLGGVAALGALGLGTLPAVFLIGTVFQSVDAVMRNRIHRLLGLTFLVLGYIPLQHGLAALGVALPHPPIPYYQPL